jgi:hypothetical protein
MVEAPGYHWRNILKPTMRAVPLSRDGFPTLWESIHPRALRFLARKFEDDGMMRLRISTLTPAATAKMPTPLRSPVPASPPLRISALVAPPSMRVLLAS